ncbi:MAG: hypothetical protein CMI53_01580 [Parcubacteria group bacterium]|nr:hypothetical protein [Parcubacteria group bacterium]|tara:strand:- start:156 stop:710 length:555 start_codon:yes stop_codon:yes gene_type:complete
MKEVVKKEILNLLTQAFDILKVREEENLEKLKEVSNKGVESVALYKDMDLISITVMIHSLYKIITSVSANDYQYLLKDLEKAKNSLKNRNFRLYNKSIKLIYKIIHKGNAKVKDHLSDVLHAARVKKSAVLLSKGLSIGQAAGLMGLSNWDLQKYAGKTTTFEQHHEAVRADQRLINALKIFGA